MGIFACQGCDLLLETGDSVPGGTELCPRCGSTVLAPKKDTVNRTLAASFAALLLYVPAVFTPLMTLNVLGLEAKGSIFDNVMALYGQGFVLVAAMVFLTAVLLPFLNPALLFGLALMSRFNRLPGLQAWILRTYHRLEEWGMAEVYLIGVLVTLIKVYSMAAIAFNPGFFCFIGMVFMNVCALTFFDPSRFWERVDKQRRDADGKGGDSVPLSSGTALAAGWIRCHDCGKLACLDDLTEAVAHECLRCGASLHARKPDSIGRTWALVIASALLLVPANVLPIMRVDLLEQSQYSTIMDGIIYFMHSGEYGIALVIFTASVLVPVFKIAGLSLVLLSVQFGWQAGLRQKSLMFRFVEFIGRWSMLDIFVIALMTVIVDFGGFTSTHAARGAPFFTSVVVCTMLAASTFDCRLLWDGETAPSC